MSMPSGSSPAPDAVAEARRVAAVLWGTRRPPSRGPAQRLTVARIVEAALTVADEEGLDGLSMRRVAAALGVGAATLYTYVPGRAELLALLVDESVGADALPHELPGDWRARTQAWARSDYAEYRARPWLLQLVGGPLVAGPNMLRWYDSALRALDGSGLTGAETVAVVDAVNAYVRGQARSDQGEMLAPSFDEEPGPPPVPHPYPALERLGAEGVFDRPDATFELGLAWLLDGVAATVARRAGVG